MDRSDDPPCSYGDSSLSYAVCRLRRLPLGNAIRSPARCQLVIGSHHLAADRCPRSHDRKLCRACALGWRAAGIEIRASPFCERPCRARTCTVRTARLDAAWLREPPLSEILAVLDNAGEEARVVGGAIRNTLLGQPPGDVDIATTALPAEVMRRAERVGFKPVPTGIEHGTVTVV